jgi:hypothetical protein
MSDVNIHMRNHQFIAQALPRRSPLGLLHRCHTGGPYPAFASHRGKRLRQIKEPPATHRFFRSPLTFGQNSGRKEDLNVKSAPPTGPNR